MSAPSRNVGMIEANTQVLAPSSSVVNQKQQTKRLKPRPNHAKPMAGIKVWDKMVNKQSDDATKLLLTVRDQRDEIAFRDLYRALSPKLLGYLQKRGMQRDGAEVVLQETFVTIWQKADQFDPTRANASAWVFQIARNKMIDRFRGEKKPLPADLEILSEQHEPDTADTVAIQDDIEALQTALGKMKSKQRDIIEKAFLGEMTHSEIQEATGLPLGTIKSRIRLGLEKLRHELSTV